MVAAAISTTAKEVELIAADPHAASALQREKFLPVTRSALADRLTVPSAWPNGDVMQVRRFLRYLDYWRRHSYTMRLLELEQSYEPFSPDSDLLTTRKYSPEERTTLRKRFVAQISAFLEQANFTRVDPSEVHVILTKDSHYGLDLQVDLKAFEEILIFYRGASTITERRRDPLKAYIGWKEVKIPVFQRLFLLFKLKPFEERVREVMQEQNIDRNDAERYVKRLRGMLPAAVSSDYVYLKLFKNLPRSDVEMIFPNTKVKFRLFDKIKFGVTAGGGLGMGVFGTASKVALLTTNPIAFAGAVVGLGGVAARQATNFIAQRNRYMVVMAQNLYFHAMADNRGVVTLLADRAAEEDVKEEMLLYSVLAKAPASIAELRHLDEAIEQYLARTFNIDVDFDVADALQRLKQDGIVSEFADGTLHTLSPHQAALRIDQLWDASLDQLPDIAAEEGQEMGVDCGDAPRA